MRYRDITCPDVCNGTGCRVILWLQGCTHHCKGCQNPETWCFNGGKEFDAKAKDKLIELLKLPYIKGLTLSGGDPLDSYQDVYNLLVELKELFKDKDIWLYTGYTLDEIENSDKHIVLDYIDYLIDGTYQEKLRDITLAFRCSSNQTIWEKKNGKFVKSSLN